MCVCQFGSAAGAKRTVMDDDWITSRRAGVSGAPVGGDQIVQTHRRARSGPRARGVFSIGAAPTGGAWRWTIAGQRSGSAAAGAKSGGAVVGSSRAGGRVNWAQSWAQSERSSSGASQQEDGPSAQQLSSATHAKAAASRLIRPAQIAEQNHPGREGISRRRMSARRAGTP